MLGKTSAWLERAAFRPESLPDDIITLVALAPPVVAGLLLFQARAAEMLAIACTIGLSAHLAARLARRRVTVSPVIPALVGVGLIGPGAHLGWAAGVASTAAVLELLRNRLVPSARLHTGLLAYVAVLLGSMGAPAAYLRPSDFGAAPEPIRLWLGFFGPSAAPVDPVRLYVGNVPGPLIATSLLAVVVGLAWLWYARRLSLMVLLGVVAGAAIPIGLMRWDAAFQLDSAPLWFATGVLLADRRLLPKAPYVRALIGFTAGLAAVAFRARGYAIEASLVAVAGIQLAVGLTEGVVWLLIEREKVAAAVRRLRGRGTSLRISRSKASGV